MEKLPKVLETTYEEANHAHDAKSWKQAMMIGIAAFNKNETWELKKLPKNHQGLPCKWVFILKENPD